MGACGASKRLPSFEAMGLRIAKPTCSFRFFFLFHFILFPKKTYIFCAVYIPDVLVLCVCECLWRFSFIESAFYLIYIIQWIRLECGIKWLGQGLNIVAVLWCRIDCFARWQDSTAISYTYSIIFEHRHTHESRGVTDRPYDATITVILPFSLYTINNISKPNTHIYIFEYLHL